MRMSDKQYAELCLDVFHEVVMLRWSEVVHVEQSTRRLYKRADFMDDTSGLSAELEDDIKREADARRKEWEATYY